MMYYSDTFTSDLRWAVVVAFLAALGFLLTWVVYGLLADHRADRTAPGSRPVCDRTITIVDGPIDGRGRGWCE